MIFVNVNRIIERLTVAKLIIVILGNLFTLYDPHSFNFH